MERYLMVAQDGENEIIVDKSRFICHVKRVYNDQDAMEFIKEIKKIGMPHITAQPIKLETSTKFKKQMMMVSQVEQLAFQCLKSFENKESKTA